MLNTRLLPSLSSSLRPGVVVPERSYLWLKTNSLTFKLCANKWLMINLIIWNRTVWPWYCDHTNDWCYWEISILGNIWIWLMLNWIVCKRSFWEFDCTWTNVQCLIKLLLNLELVNLVDYYQQIINI